MRLIETTIGFALSVDVVVPNVATATPFWPVGGEPVSATVPVIPVATTPSLIGRMT